MNAGTACALDDGAEGMRKEVMVMASYNDAADGKTRLLAGVENEPS